MGVMDDLKALQAEADRRLQEGREAQRLSTGYLSPDANPFSVNAPPNPLQAAVGNGAPPPEQDPSEIPDMPAVPGSNVSGQDEAEGVEAATGARGFVFPRLPGGFGVAKPPVIPEGENYLPFGGEQGKQLWEDTFVTKPQQLDSAIQAGAKAEEDLGNQRADFFKRTQESQAHELAVLRERQAHRQAEVQAKQAELEQVTQRYSNDLADRGKFWRNPANILGAIGAVLIAAGSPGDPGIGIRIINQAVENDFAKRKAAADMHLGQLRSNVAAYRQMVGDKDIGDRMAFLESQRIAAMELERIGAQFQGPIAKAKAAAISAEMLRNYQIQMGQLHAQMVYNKSQRIDPGIKAAMEATGRATGGVGYTPFGQSPPGAPGTAPTGKAPAQAAPAIQGPDGKPLHPSQERQFIDMLMPPMDEKTRAAYEKRSPGSSRQLEAERSDVAKRIWSISGGNPKTFNQKMEEFERWVESDIKDIAKAAQPALDKVNGYRRLQQDIGILENTAKRLGKTPDELLGSGSEAVFGKSFMRSLDDKMNALMRDDPENSDKYRRERQEVADAVARFKQLYAGHTNAYIKDTSGGAVSVTEDARLQDYLRLGWRGIRTFYEDRSSRANAELRGAANTAAHPVSGTLFKIQYGLGTQGLDVKGIEGKDKFRGSQEAVDERRQGNIRKAVQNLKNKSGK